MSPGIPRKVFPKQIHPTILRPSDRFTLNPRIVTPEYNLKTPEPTFLENSNLNKTLEIL